MKTKIYFLILLVLAVACKSRNNLNTNEQQLAAQIKTEEQEKQEAEAEEKQNSVAIPDTLPVGFRFHEDRSVDPMNPPVVIDFTGGFDTINLKLSDIAQKVKYIRLQVPHDSMYFTRHARLHFAKDFLVVSNNFGIQKFTKEGKFVESICYNELGPNRIPDRSKKFGGFFRKEDFKGAWGNQVSVQNNQVLYKFTNYSKKTYMIPGNHQQE